MRTYVRFLQGFVLGGLIGVVLALLFAPASGEALRGQIQGEMERVRSEVTNAASERRIELEQQLAALRSPNRPSGV
jgi:gas vesicle protein